jgi:hypothetical protein
MKPTRPAGDSPAPTEPRSGSAERQQDGRRATVPGREPATTAASAEACAGIGIPVAEVSVPYWPTAKACREAEQ